MIEKKETIPKSEAKALQSLRELKKRRFKYIIEQNRITEINLDGCGLFEFPQSIISFKKLKILRIGDNSISSLPNSITELINLKELDISRNRFTRFPKQILSLKDIKEIYIGSNFLKELPQLIR